MKLLPVRKYLNETSLHGFLYINDKNKFFAACWTILTSVCIYYAIHDIVKLIETYQSVPTSVSVSVTPNLNAIIPTPTLCMETMVEAPENNFNIEDINIDIKAFMKATNNGMNLNVNNTEIQLTDRLEYLTYLMLSYITDLELLYTGERNPVYTAYVNDYQISHDDKNFINASSTLFQSFVQPVYNAYMTYKVSLSNLKRLVGMSICNKQIGFAKYGSLLGDNNSPPITSMCNAETITHLSFGLLCVKMFNNNTFEVKSGLTVSLGGLISASKDPLPSFIRYRKCQDNLGFNGYSSVGSIVAVKFLWYIDLQGRSVLPDSLSNDIFAIDPVLPGSRYDVAIANQYDFYNVPNIPSKTCSNDIRHHDCIKQKKAEMISQSCKCWPSTLLNVVNTNKMPTCSDNFANLNVNVSINVTYLQCQSIEDANVTDLCNHDCQAYLFSVGVVDSVSSVDIVSLRMSLDRSGVGPPIVGSMEINFRSESLRTLTVESPSMPFTIFACSFGGIIGTYLGGSILAFLHIPIFILAQLTGLLIKPKKVENSEKKINKAEIYPTVKAESNRF